MNPLGSVASGVSTEKKNATGSKMAAVGAETRATQRQPADRRASSTYRSMTRCEPTTHRLLLKVSRPPPHHPPECRPGPTLPGSVRVGSSVHSPSQASPGGGTPGAGGQAAQGVFPHEFVKTPA